MRKFNLTSGVIGLAVIGLAACSHDELQTPTSENRTDIERSLYVNISIHGNVGESRGAQADGEPEDNDTDFKHAEDESEIRSVYFVFYDDNGNPVGDVVSGAPAWDKETAQDNTVETVGKETLMITLAAGQENPTQVVCYINPINRTHLKNPLSTIQTVELESVYSEEGENTYFPMSNSVYYDGQNVVTATQLNDKIYDSLEAANKALNEGDVVNIYVERYASKLQMHVEEDAVQTYVTGTLPDDGNAPNSTTTPIKVNLTFSYKGWELNGVANSTYPVKSFREASTQGMILPNDMEYDFINSRINYEGYYTKDIIDYTTSTILPLGKAWAWNNSGFHRSYWACSPVYFQSDYPEVATDLSTITDLNQTFYKYQDVLNNGKVFDQPYYFPETTSGIPALISKNPAAAVPSVILVGDYSMTLTPQGSATEVAIPSTEAAPLSFYTYVPVRLTVNDQTVSRPSVYFETAADGISSAVEHNTMSMKKRLLWQASIFYKKLADGSYEKYDMTNANDVEVLSRLTVVARPNDRVLGDVKMAARTRTLQIDKDAIIPDIYINNSGVPQKLVSNSVSPTESEITIDQANQILWMNVGTCNYYSKSRGFFNIPVKHTGWYRGGNSQKDKNDIDFSMVRVGDLGMVRNHTYSIKVSQILGLATGVGGDEYPLLPAADTKDVYVAYRVNILKWAIVPEQGVILE